jgi:hypothetical protein
MTIAEEAQRYLEVVEFFRSQGCEPQWRPEPQSGPRRPHASRSHPKPVQKSNRCSG